MSWLTKSLVSSVLTRLGKFIGLSLGPKSLVPCVLAHEEPGPKCPGSIRKSITLVLDPKSLVPSVLARFGSLSS